MSNMPSANQSQARRFGVVFSDTPEGATALTFAANLNRSAGSGKLAVYVGVDAACRQIAQAQSEKNADLEQHLRVLTHVQTLTDLSGAEVEVVDYDPAVKIVFPTHMVIVSHDLVADLCDRNVLTPYDEASLDARGEGPFIIPFGDGDSGLDAASVGLPLAVKLGRSVVFYHTTWRSGVDSSDARDHLCPEAEDNLTELEAAAQLLGVQFKTRLEMAPDVAEGILHTAASESASLIVLARGRKTKVGSYVNQVLEQSPIPTMVAATSTARPRKNLNPNPAKSRVKPKSAERPAEESGAPSRFNAALAFIGKHAGNPIFVMGVVALMYIVKAVVKISLGTTINSPMLTGDGLHNIADIFEALAVIAVIKISMRPPSERYAYGRKNIEFVSAGAVGLGLIGMALLFTVKSVTGILHEFPSIDAAVRAFLPLPTHEPLIMSAAHFPWVVAVTAGSVILSLFVSRYQIRVGKKTGHDSLIADGQETASDGRIEMVALVGVLAEYFFHAPWLEYPLGILIAVLIFRTGKELWLKAWHVLLQHTIGVEHDQEIRRTLSTTHGVATTESVKTFQVGRIAVCHLTVTTRRTANTVTHIKYAIERAVEKYVLAQDFHKVETHINFQPPSADRHRQAVAIIRSGGRITVAPTIEAATSILIMDFEFGRVIRVTEEDPQGNPLSLLAVKRVCSVRQFADTSALETQLQGLGIQLLPAVSYLPAALGLNPRVLG